MVALTASEIVALEASASAVVVPEVDVFVVAACQLSWYLRSLC